MFKILNELVEIPINDRLIPADRRTRGGHNQAYILQQYLDRLQKWEADWLMQLNPDKCEVIRSTNRRGRRIDSDYTIHGTVLREVSSGKYLGVTIDSKLTLNPHVANVTKKANNTRAFLQRNINRCPANKSLTSKKHATRHLSDPQSSMPPVCGIHLLPRTSLQWKWSSDVPPFCYWGI